MANGTAPSVRILPDSVGGETSVSESSTPTTLIEDTEEQTIDAPADSETTLTVKIASTGSAGESVSPGDVRVFEDGRRQEVTAVEYSVTTLDLVFVFDDTGSMADEIHDMQAGVKELTTAVANRDIDARYALVSFKDDPEVDTRFTRDPDRLKRAVDDMWASGGGDAPEDNWGAVMTALDLEHRPDAQTMIVDITDASSHYRDESSQEHPELPDTPDNISDLGFGLRTGDSDYIMDEVASELARADADFVAVSPDMDHERCSVKSLAGHVDGLWTDISERSFDEVLDHVVDVLVGTYTVSYFPVGDPRGTVPVRVEYDDPGSGTVSDTVQVRRPESGSTASTATDSRVPPAEQDSASRSGRSTSHRGQTKATTDTRVPNFCPSCGYDLQVHDDPSFCPECGDEIDV